MTTSHFPIDQWYPPRIRSEENRVAELGVDSPPDGVLAGASGGVAPDDVPASAATGVVPMGSLTRSAPAFDSGFRTGE